MDVNERVELFNGNGGLVEGSIKNVRVNGLDILAMEEPKSVLPQSTQWHVFAACGKILTRNHRTFSASYILMAWKLTYLCLGTLKGGRADWLVEKCTVSKYRRR